MKCEKKKAAHKFLRQENQHTPYKNFYRDVKRLYGKHVTIYGPYYRRRDNRRIVVLHNRSIKFRTTKLYAKIKLEIKLGRILGKNDTVDHIDENPLNDKFDNLALLSLAENIKRSVIRLKAQHVKCAWCKEKFKIRGDQRNKSKKKAGPFCSRRCSGKYGAHVQNGGQKQKRTKIKTYTIHMHKEY